MSNAWRQLFDPIAKYWTIIIATCGLVWYLGGFVVSVNQLQTEQTALRLRIVEIEQRQTKIEDKVNTQNVEVLTRLSRMEAILEEIRKR